MKITIVSEFSTPVEAAAFLARVVRDGSAPAAEVSDNPTSAPVPQATTDKPARKPRADAGQKREPYGPRTTEAKAGEAGAPSGTPSTATSGQEPAASAAAPTAASPAAASPAKSSAPAQGQSSGTAGTPTSAAEDFPATLEGARKAMAALNATTGRGMDACIQALKAAGVNRISDLPKEKYADFIKDVLVQSSA